MPKSEKIHEIVSKVKQLSKKLKRTPNSREATELDGVSQAHIWRLFGGYNKLLDACGLKPEPKSKKKQVKDIFDKSIVDTVLNFDAPPRCKFSNSERILLIPDTHFPFVDKQSLKKIYEFAAKVKPTIIIQLGDLYDMFSQGKFPRSMNNYNPHEEIELGRKMANEMWDKLKSISKKAKCYQLLGNHDIRPIKRVIESCPEVEPFFSIKDYFTFKNVTTIHDSRHELIINGIAFLHGYRTKLGDHRDYMLKSCAHGHTHRGGVHFKNIDGKTLFELDCGYIGDPNSKALSYTAQKITHWTHGFGYIDEYGPRFIQI